MSVSLQDLLSQQCDKQAVVFLKDVRFVDLKALVDYMYRGEVNVSQDQLAAFLSTAESLRIKGLADKDDNYRVPGQLASSNKPVSARKRRRNSTSRMTNEQLPSSQGAVCSIFYHSYIFSNNISPDKKLSCHEEIDIKLKHLV